MKVEESSPLYETHSCLHENDGARLDRSLMTILRYGDIGREGKGGRDGSDLSCRCKREAIEWPSGPVSIEISA